MDTLYWHDYETFGTDPRRDRAAQFAGQRTDQDLNPLGDPLVLYCQPTSDYLPQVGACLVTGITPQQAQREGVPEAQFIAAIVSQLGAPGTCGVGYNSIRFDDEVTRNLLFRNFYEPYEREWREGNSRWDLIDVTRLTYALRPTGIEWPQHEDGSPSFRLEHLAQANHLQHGQAHDALADVHTTIALARLLRQRQPRLYHYCYSHRRKQQVSPLIELKQRRALVHVSARYPAKRGCLTMIVPLARHPNNANGVIVYDLMAEPTPLISLDAEALADRLFTPRADLPSEVERVPLKVIHLNRAPVLAPLSVLRHCDTQRIGLDPERCLAHLAIIQRASGLSAKLKKLFDVPYPDSALDPEESIYQGGFPSSADRALIARVAGTPAPQLAALAPGFQDPRYRELLFRYRARNHKPTLTAEENQRWDRFRRQRLLLPEGDSAVDRMRTELGQARTQHPQQTALLDQLEAHLDHLIEDL